MLPLKPVFAPLPPQDDSTSTSSQHSKAGGSTALSHVPSGGSLIGKGSANSSRKLAKKSTPNTSVTSNTKTVPQIRDGGFQRANSRTASKNSVSGNPS